MKIRPHFCLIAVALMAAGCKPGHSIVGKWSTTAQGKPLTMSFTSDSKVVATTDTAQPMPMTITITGTYTLDKDFFLDIKFTDMSVKVADASKQSLVDSVFAGQKKQALEQINKVGSKGKLTWKTEDEVSVAGSDGTVQTMTRIKA